MTHEQKNGYDTQWDNLCEECFCRCLHTSSFTLFAHHVIRTGQPENKTLQKQEAL
jgi:hypothetical protein